MVYRYESDEDTFVEYPEPRSELPTLGAGPPAPAGPSPSRFPTPSLPRTTQAAPPAADPIPVPQTDEPRAHEYASTEPVELPRSRRVERGGGGGRLWQVLIGGAAVLVLLALCGLGAAALLTDRTPEPQGAAPTEQPGVAQSAEPDKRQDLDSRDTDQQPLTAKEVFPGTKLAISDGQPAYQVLTTQSSGSCAVAATNEVADLLVRLGCNQVVRATLRSPDGDHLVTAGLFNLTDVATAQRVRDRIRQMLDERQGRFRGMAAGGGTEAIATAAARVGWQVRGHYLAYCLVTRADGETITSSDPKVPEILYDMIELHLNKGVLERRADGGTTGQPTASRSDSTGSQTGDAGELPGN